jgi:hypothetical protein
MGSNLQKLYENMIINITFDCECSGSVDRNIEIPDWDTSPTEAIERHHYEQLLCDGCTKDYEAHVSEKNGALNVYVAGVFNLGWEQIDHAHFSYNNSAGSYDGDLDDELTWVIKSTVQLDNFQKIMTDVVALLRANIVIPNMSTLYNMAYAQVVTAVEAYLSGIFIHTVVNSNEHMRKLVETDPELAKRQFSLKEIFEQWEGLQLLVARYLQELIFHDLKKIKPMYKSVLDIDFGDISWLFKAVLLRHDCVHRNGVDKNGKHTGIGQEEIETLVRQCVVLIARLDKEVAEMQAVAPSANE